MKKRMKRLAAMLLLGCMVAGSVPGGLVYAEESDPVTAESQTEEITKNEESDSESDTMPGLMEDTEGSDSIEAEDDQTSGNNVPDAEDNQTSGNDVQEAENDQASESDVQETDDAEKLQESDGKETDDQNEEAIDEQASEGSIIEKNADAINYVIVESPYLETPGTERIAVSYGDGSENISDATLTVRDDEGQETIWDLSVSADQLYLFTYEYTDESETGTYEVISLNVTDDTGEKAVLLSESGMEANFGVNKEYSGIEELQPLDVETAKSRTADEAADVEATVAEIDPDNVEESTEQIVNALENAEEQTGGATDSSAGISAFAATMGAKAKAAAAKSDDGNIVVALDPGHDSTHAGASSNGLREEVLTLKIANYCKEELEKYAGVTVYMTRTGAACPHPGGSSGSDIGDRVYAAADAGADIYVSLHLNSSTASSVNGSEVIIPNKSWKPQVAEEGEKLAEAILKELKAIGLNMRPDEIYSKDTTINERYPDGSISDYFSVQIYAKERGIPGIIVEHAFITNSGDRNYLKSESGLKKLGVADATGIAKYLGLEKIGEKVSVEEGTYILESALESGKVATVSNGSIDNYDKVILNDKNGSSAQRFEITSIGNGYYTITAEHSGKVLDINGASTANGAVIQQYTGNNTAAQKWGFVSAGNGYYYITSALGTFMDVKSGQTANGTQIQSYAYNGSNAQKWRLVKSDYRPVEDGTYTISSDLSDNIVLDVKSASMSDQTNVQVYTSNNSSAQRFEIAYVSDGYYSIKTEHASKALDIKSGSKINGANVQQYAWNESNAQLWKFVDAGDGSYYIRSKCGTVLDIDGGKAISGANVYAWAVNYGKDQKWNLKKSDYRPVKDGNYVIASYAAQSQVVTEKNGNIQLEKFANSGQQKYRVEYIGEGFYKITNTDTKKVVDVKGGSSASNANVQTYTWNGTDAQLWKFIDAKNGSYYIKSKVGTTMDLPSAKTASGTNIQTYAMNGTNAQKWVLDSDRASYEEVKIEEGTYTIKNATNTSQVLDVQSSSMSNSANVQTYVSNNTSAQRFEIMSAGNGYYKILMEHSGKAVDIKGGSAAAEANVQQYQWNGTDAQLWKFIKTSDGKYYIQSKVGTVLDLKTSTASSGTNVQTDDLKGENSQKWILTKSEYRPVTDGTYVISSYSASDKAATEKNGNFQLETFVNDDAQKYQVTYAGNGYYKIVCKNDGHVVDVKGGSAAAKTNIQLYQWNGSDAQLWKFIDAKNGSYYIKSKLGTTMDLPSAKTTAGTNIQAYTMNGTDAQKWVLDKSKAVMENVELKEGTYIFLNSAGFNQAMDVESASKASGANIQTYQLNNTSAQHFKITQEINGYYRITAEHSNMVLDIKGGSSVAGTNVQQYKWNGTDAQLWRFIKSDDGKYYILSKKGTVLDISDSTASSGSNVQTDTLKFENTQKWAIQSVTELYPIMGESDTTVKQMAAYFNSKNKDYPYEDSDAPTIEKFCQMYFEECEAEGVKAEVAFCQAMLETAFLKFGGNVDKEQYNFAGLGATGGGVKGESFPNVQTGIRAQVQHLKAYASTQDLNQDCVDTRFKFVTRGCAPYVQWLGIQENPNSNEQKKMGWAAGKNYGYNIVNQYIVSMKTF